MHDTYGFVFFRDDNQVASFIHGLNHHKNFFFQFNGFYLHSSLQVTLMFILLLAHETFTFLEPHGQNISTCNGQG